MEELYRYLMIRPSEAIDEEKNAEDIADLTEENDFQAAIRNTDKQDERIKLAKAFITKGQGFNSTEEVPMGTALLKLAEHYAPMLIDHEASSKDIRMEAAAILAKYDDKLTSPEAQDDPALKAWFAKIAGNDDWKNNTVKLKNTLLAVRESNLLPREAHRLAKVLKGMLLVDRLATSDADDIRPGAIVKATLYYTDVKAAKRPMAVADSDLLKEDQTLQKKREEFLTLAKVTDELINVPLSQIQPNIVEREIRPDETREGAATRLDTSRLETTRIEAARLDATTGEDNILTKSVSRNIALSKSALNRLTPETQNAIRQFNLDPAREGLDTILSVVRTQQLKSMPKVFKSPVKYKKGTWQSANKFVQAGLDSFLKPGWLSAIVPTTTGNVAPVGIGDLLIVKQQLKRYQGGDIAHIENILQGEEKAREHRRRRMSETVFVSEVETEASEERETQTTKRYEMGLEVSKQVQEEFGLEAGVNISASYGPTVKVESNTDFSYKNAKSESRKMANSMSKETVEKASTKYREKVREEQTRRLVEEVEEFNRHALDATTAHQHIVGVYQWINKVYEAQVYNYGLRVMYEFMVPEPAAYYIWSLNQQADETEGLVVPPPFNISANDVDEWNYKELIALYECEEVGPPPEPWISVAIHKTGGPNPEKGPMVDSDAATIPDGYEYVTYSSNWSYNYKSNDPTHGFGVEVSHAFQTPGSVPVHFHGYSVTAFSAYVHILCRRTQTAYEKWRQQAWDAMYRGHQQQVAKYEEKLAAILAKEGIAIEGRNPLFNRQTEQIELKKSAITLLTGSYPSWLNGIFETVGGPIPGLAAAESQGAYVRFMEQAFEWKNMTYLFYPYFWARKKEWLKLNAIEDVDPQFKDFLTSGYARVVVPVRPGFETAVEHFRQTGQIWSGGKLPDISDPDYLPIAQEIKEKLDAPGEEEPVGEPWEVVVPTQLVKLRPNNDLPKWEKQPDGTWQEVES